MPYRRLPNTDQTRLKALQQALTKADEAGFGQQAMSFRTINEARAALTIFQKQFMQYQQVVANKVTANKHYRHIAANARMYISHFIQVLNLSVIRGEIKKEQKTLYNLGENSHTVPDLSSDDALLTWGKNIIDGENERLRMGGLPIYNPTIAKVKVHYDIFKECHSTQMLYKSNTERNKAEVDALRAKVDAIIFEMWNQIEEFYKEDKPYAKLCHCQAYGVVYYYRNGEEPLTPEVDIALQRLEDSQPSIPLFD